MKALFLVGQFLPLANANGVCVSNVIGDLKKIGVDSDVICYGDSESIESNTFGCEHISRVKWKESKRASTSYMQKVLRKIRRIISIPFYPVGSVVEPGNILSYRNAVVNVLKREKYDAVVCAYHPLAPLLLWRTVRRWSGNAPTILYFLDTMTHKFPDQSIAKTRALSRIERHKDAVVEKKAFDRFNCVFMMESYRKLYAAKEFDACRKKFVYVDFPLMIPRENKMEGKNEQTIQMIYTGGLYKQFRNPAYMCETIRRLVGIIDVHVSFYTNGDCDDILESFHAGMESSMTLHGFRPHQEVIEAVDEADVLLSIGNANMNMVPSKLFEYMSTGKKIIHFTHGSDSCQPYLSKYPAALILDEHNSIDHAAACVKGFLEERTCVNLDELQSEFAANTPAFTARKLLACMKGIGQYDV